MLSPEPAHAQTARPATAAAKSIELRASISAEASSYFVESRLRRLLAIELQNTAIVSPSSAGPLGDSVAWAWIDLIERSTALVEVRVASGVVLRRTISIDGLGSDAAARHVAIAVAEMVRALAHPSRARKPLAAKPACCEQLEAQARATPTLVWSAGAGAAVVTSPPLVLAGPWLGLGLRYHNTSGRVFGRWFGGEPGFGSVSWLEAGLGIDHRLSLHPSWRLWLGALASAATVRLGGVQGVDGIAGDRASWCTRAGASVGLETRLGETMWLSLSAEPGAILRPVGFELQGGGRDRLAGAWIGLDLSLQFERRP